MSFLNKSILDSLSAQIAVLNNEGVILVTNRSWGNFYKKNKVGLITVGSGVGVNYLEHCLNLPQLRKKALELNQGINSLLEGEGDSFQLTYAVDDIKWYSLKVNLLKEEGRVIVIHEDVTEKITDKNLLLMEHMKFQNLFSESPVGILIIDDFFKIVQANKSFCQFVGYTAEELKELTPSDITFPADIKKTESMIRKMVSGKINRDKVEKRYIKKDGKIIWGEVINRDIKLLSGKKLIYTTIVDITEKKEREEALLISQERLILATSQKNIGIWDWNIKENNLIWDDSMFDLYGLSKEDFDGSFQAWEKSVYEDDLDAVYKEVELALLGKKRLNTEFRIVTNKGIIKYIRAQAIVQFNEDNEAVRMAGINTDVTERLELEREKHIIIGRAEEAERQRISHDLHDGLGQKIAAANIYMNVLDGLVKDQLDEETLAIFNVGRKLVTEAARETRLVSQNITPRSIKQFGLEKSGEEMVSNYQKRHTEISIKLDSNLGDIRFNEEVELAVFRILQELVSNGLKHSGASKIDVVLSFDKIHLFVEVNDNGKGFNVDDVKTRKNTGIGFVSLKHRVELLKGKLTINSRLKRGVKVGVKIPISRIL